MLPHNNDTGRYGVIGIPSFSPSRGARRPSARCALALFAVAVFLLASAAYAGRYELIRKDDPRESYQFSDIEGVCAAFEKNLKRFEDRPYGMACRRELDPKLGFSRPTWEKLDVMKHLDLALDILRFSGWDKTLPVDPRPWPERIKDMVEKQHLTLELTRLDVNRDGKPDNLVRFGFERPCDSRKMLEQGLTGRNKALYMIEPSLKKVDPSSRHSGIYDDVFLFKGHIYTDTFWDEPLSTRSERKRDATLELFGFFEKGAAPICKFHYFDSTTSRGGK